MNRTISSIPFGCASLLARTAEMASRTISLSTPKQILHRGTSALCPSGPITRSQRLPLKVGSFGLRSHPLSRTELARNAFKYTVRVS
jgi:hypothetical protein